MRKHPLIKSLSPNSHFSSTPTQRSRFVSWPAMTATALALMAMSGVTTKANAHQGLAGSRLLPWPAAAAQYEIQPDVELTKELEAPALKRSKETAKRHDLANQTVLGDGGQQTIDVNYNGESLPPPDLQFERSFLSELPEAADREKMEWRHDENG